ncbi:MAG: alanine/glycine:cation symporter family protein [Pseudomonadota bacterium]
MASQAPADPVLALVENIASFMWAGQWEGADLLPFPPMAIILLGGGLYMMAILRFYPILKLGAAISGLFKSRKGEGEGEISPFAALSTALSGQVGTGNLAGVASAIALGGPGAVFWMWITALIGMALAFSEGALAIRFREKTSDGTYRGGPMTYIMMGLGPKWSWLAILFCILLLFSLVTGNAIQANAVADGLNELFGVSELIGGIIVAVAVFIVIIGGIKSIGSVAEKVIPFMAGLYIALALLVLVMNASAVPGTFGLIFQSAFNPSAAAGGFAGALLILAIRAGVARGLFSNEAGQGSTPIAHAVAQTNDPEQQGRMAMLGTFIDTIVVCTMTALVILTVQGSFVVGGDVPNADEVVAYSWQTKMAPFEMTSGSFGTALPFEIAGIPFGTLLVSLVLILFVFTTLLTWSYYGERALTFLYDRIPGSTRGGEKVLHMVWRVSWCVVIVLGASQKSDLVWALGDISNASMTVPNLLALLLLSGVVVRLSRGERDAGTTHLVDTPEEPNEY